MSQIKKGDNVYIESEVTARCSVFSWERQASFGAKLRTATAILRKIFEVMVWTEAYQQENKKQFLRVESVETGRVIMAV